MRRSIIVPRRPPSPEPQPAQRRIPASARTRVSAGEGPVAIVSPRAADRLRAGHVWIYRSDIEQIEQIVAGDSGLLAVADDRGLPLGTALWSPHSQIALRLISTDLVVDHDAWLALLDQRLRSALDLREGMLDEGSDACRLVFSETDQLPGHHRRPLQRPHSASRSSAKALDREDTRRDDRSRRSGPKLDPSDHCRARRPAHSGARAVRPARPTFRSTRKMPFPQLATIFHINGLMAFHYDARAGQQTGAFLDQRRAESRRRSAMRTAKLSTFAPIRAALRLHLARACSADVTGVDASRAALEGGRRESGGQPASHCRARSKSWMEANAFDLLARLTGAAKETTYRHHRARSAGLRKIQARGRARCAAIRSSISRALKMLR